MAASVQETAFSLSHILFDPRQDLSVQDLHPLRISAESVSLLSQQAGEDIHNINFTD